MSALTEDELFARLEEYRAGDLDTKGGIVALLHSLDPATLGADEFDLLLVERVLIEFFNRIYVPEPR